MNFRRRTLGDTAKLAGVGLHSGELVSVSLHPATDGITFRRGSDCVAAKPENVVDTGRCTRLSNVSTVEHFMSAFAALGITDVTVEVDAAEMPGLDGSALPVVEAVLAAGLVEIGSATLHGPFARVFDKGESHSVAVATGEGWWRYCFDTGAAWPGLQDFEIRITEEAYREAVAPARTFCFEHELEAIRKAGLGRGLDESSALVIGQGSYLNEARFSDEPARHKLLDLLGDLYLSGVPPQLLNIVAEKSGHTANVAAARKLAEHVKIEFTTN